MHIPSKLIAIVILTLAAGASFNPALAAEIKMIAKVDAITLATDGKSAQVKLTNTKGGAPVTVKITDKATLDKLAEKGIAVGDQVRLSYDDTGGSNLTKTFKKAEGC
jgi:hypothetical protein